MNSEIYENKALYYNFMKDFLQKRMNSWEFRTKYLGQRSRDSDQDKKNGYTYEKYEEELKNLTENEKKFEKEYYDVLNYEGMSVLKEYEKGAKILDIKGEMFFMGIWNYVDCPIIEHYPSDREGFDSKEDIDEQTLTEIIQAAFDVLERNKDRWEMEKQSKENNGEKI
jgi:uncharacterized protein YyaL (SSP411 family)